MKHKVSVIICTRNRSTRLADTCESVLACRFTESWELVIVDNASTDDTRAVAESVARSSSSPVRVVVEEELGLSAARNAGIRETRAPYILYLDDDAFPASDWLEEIIAGLEQPGVMAVGGPVDLRMEGEIPTWLDNSLRPYLSEWDLGNETIDLVYNELPRGANIGFRREAFDRVGDFSTFLGRRGQSLRSGEEIEVCLRLERARQKIRYVPNARVDHLVDANRLTEDWLVGRFGAQGRSEAIIEWRHGGLDALRVGYRRLRRTAGSQSPDALFGRCARVASRAYFWQALVCPLTIPRFRETKSTGPLDAFHPLP
ncbi:MAG: glycosyltransferase [Thermoanaerobaculia bacterium]|nr:glycosyltransferase [Thermoanaerobaculia bacterium]